MTTADPERTPPATSDADWMRCETRRPWIANSLRHRVSDLRAAERKMRRAFNKDHMGIPSRWLAGAYAEAATVLERRLAEIDHERDGHGRMGRES